MHKKIKDLNIVTIAIMTILIGVASIVGYLFQHAGFPETNIILVYLLSVLITSVISKGCIYRIIASVLATTAFNYFFYTTVLFPFGASSKLYSYFWSYDFCRNYNKQTHIKGKTKCNKSTV